MKRRLIFLYRYFTSSRRWRRWINAQTVMIALVTLAFAATLWLTAPFSTAFNTPDQIPGMVTATPNPSAVGPTSTPIPADFLITNPQSLSISLGAAMLVLIVVAGVLMFMPRKSKT